MKCLHCESDALEEVQKRTFKCLKCGSVNVLRFAEETTSPPPALEKSTDSIADSTQKGQNVVNNGRNDSLGRLPVSLLINGY